MENPYRALSDANPSSESYADLADGWDEGFSTALGEMQRALRSLSNPSVLSASQYHEYVQQELDAAERAGDL